MTLALYLRLSKEDGDIVDESNSITNQRYILTKYIDQRPELQQYEVEEYVDDGYSGKNFERPGVMRLLEDVKSGKIYGIIVKDFSRFGRNHIEVGNYIEKIFPLLDVRFIAVNNHFDSTDYLGTTPDMDVAFENLMYDYFSEENSVKIKNDLSKKRMRGNFMAPYAPYGYIKSPENHNLLLVDEEAAEIVKLIFEMYAECGVKAEVARYLNTKQIPTPQEYATQKGIRKHWKYEKEKKMWRGAIVGRILQDPVYIGILSYHKSESAEVGSRKRKCIPKEQWKTSEAAHEPIVSAELFNLVNSADFKTKMKSGKSRISNTDSSYDSSIYCEGTKRKRGSKDSPIKGLVKCGGCKHNLIRRSRLHASYYCFHYYEVKAQGCCSGSVSEAEFLEVVKEAICKQAMVAAGLKKLFDVYEKEKSKRLNQLQKEKTLVLNKIQKCKDEIFSVYEKYKSEEITREDFQMQRQRSQERLEVHKKQLEDLESKKDVQNPREGTEIFSLLEGKESITVLTKEVVHQLVSQIYVYNGKRVEIVFRFRDEMENLLKTTEKDLIHKKS